MRAHVHLERAHLAIAEDRPSVAAQELDKGEETYKKLGARWHLDQVSALRLRSRRPGTVEDGSLDGTAGRIGALGSKLATIEDMDTLLLAVLDEMLDVTAAERGFVILVDEDLRPIRKAVEASGALAVSAASGGAGPESLGWASPPSGAASGTRESGAGPASGPASASASASAWTSASGAASVRTSEAASPLGPTTPSATASAPPSGPPGPPSLRRGVPAEASPPASPPSAGPASPGTAPVGPVPPSPVADAAHATSRWSANNGPARHMARPS